MQTVTEVIIAFNSTIRGSWTLDPNVWSGEPQKSVASATRNRFLVVAVALSRIFRLCSLLWRFFAFYFSLRLCYGWTLLNTLLSQSIVVSSVIWSWGNVPSLDPNCSGKKDSHETCLPSRSNEILVSSLIGRMSLCFIHFIDES